MQAAELWWSGKEEAFSYKLDRMAPSCFRIDDVIHSAMIKSSSSRDGVVFRADVFQKEEVKNVTVYFSQWKVGMETSIAATESTAKAQASIDSLKKTLDDFRGTVKNDLTSMKAASQRVQNEVLQMKESYKQAQDLLTSPDFTKAIENAERMAAALTAIQALTETKISVAVFGGDKK